MSISRLMLSLIGALGVLACQNTSAPNVIPATESGSDDKGGLVTAQSTYNCWGSWRTNGDSGGPYTTATNQQFGGAVTIAGAQTMLDECKNRIKNDTYWRNSVCVGMPAGGWSVHTDYHVSTCADVSSDPPECNNSVGFGNFWNECVDGVLGTIGP